MRELGKLKKLSYTFRRRGNKPLSLLDVRTGGAAQGRENAVKTRRVDQAVFNQGDHALASSTTGPTIMSEFSENMDVSLTRQAQVAACEKYRNKVSSSPAMSLHDGRSHSPTGSS
ncbi:hypothetical protein TNCV_1465101 [Trichonephila clavipes]|nr:hypothetical protein TNCV_1465101 [Trichonephila clavipes]